ncbi:MAG: hypothetical protein EB084_04450 [Proteobacteria bacterium]|nr:hypothetical protein [Pseudomonadota bacterium]
MKRLSNLAWAGLFAASLLTFGCSSEQAPKTSSAPPPAANNAPPPAAAPASPGGGGAPVAMSSTGPDGQLLPGWAKWSGKKDPVADDAKSLAAGKELFAKNCASCHGAEGKGDGPAGMALEPKPRNFTTGEYKYGSEDWQVMRTIWEGMPPPNGMAKWDGRMDEKEAWTLVHYVKSLGPKKS